MGRLILTALAVVVLAGLPALAAEPAATEVDRYELSCEPIGVMVPSDLAPESSGPALAVVDVHVRPRRSRVLLDERDLGPAAQLDGAPGHLFLAPGRYRMTLVHPGYRTALFEVAAEAGCLYRVKHRMVRVPGQATAAPASGPGLVATSGQRVFQPVTAAAPTATTRPARGAADPALRPELLPANPAAATPAAGLAGLVLKVTPSEATVSLDGAPIGTAGELGRLELPLAVSAGEHRVGVLAPGYEPATSAVVVAPGATLTVELALTASAPSQ